MCIWRKKILYKENKKKVERDSRSRPAFPKKLRETCVRYRYARSAQRNRRQASKDVLLERKRLNFVWKKNLIKEKKYNTARSLSEFHRDKRDRQVIIFFLIFENRKIPSDYNARAVVTSLGFLQQQRYYGVIVIK